MKNEIKDFRYLSIYEKEFEEGSKGTSNPLRA
jgi:hypothetical protein